MLPFAEWPKRNSAFMDSRGIELGNHQRAWLHGVCLILVGVVVMTLNLGNTHLWDQDEGYYATAAAEMYRANDWVTPTFNGKLFAHKPPMMYWGMMIGYRLFGVNELGARAVSSIFGVLTILMTYLIGRKLFDPLTGLFSGLAVGSCIVFTMVARSATADAHLTFFVTLSLYVWTQAYFSAAGESRNEKLAGMPWSSWACSYAVMGLAVMTKGPIGFLFPMAIIGLFLLTEQNPCESSLPRSFQGWWKYLLAFTPIPFVITVWKMRPWTAAFCILMVSAPWYALVQWRTDGAFLREFIGVHHLGRFAGAMDNHSGPFYYYLVACVLGMYPWSAFAIPSLLNWIGESGNAQQTRAIRLVSCWALVYLVIFSLASTKLPNYVLPAYPALAIMVGRYFARWIANRLSVNAAWHNIAWGCAIGVGAILLVAFPSAALVPWKGQTLLDGLSISAESQQRLIGFGLVGVPLVVLGTMGWWLVAKNRAMGGGVSFAIAAVVMMLVLSHKVAPDLDRFQQMQAQAEGWRDRLSESKAQVAVLDCFRPSMVFYFQRELQFCDSPTQAIELVQSDANSIMVTTSERYEQIKEQIPSTQCVLERMAQFPTQDDIVVIGNSSLKR